MLFETYRRDGLEISTDLARLDLATIHGFLRTAYWCENIPIEVVEKSIRHSLCFGMYKGSAQIGFARLVTDRATFAYLGDVFILPGHRGKGLSKWLLQCVLGHPDLQGLRRVLLATRDAHGLYRQGGFTGIAHPEWFMEILQPGLYNRDNKSAGEIGDGQT